MANVTAHGPGEGVRHLPGMRAAGVGPGWVPMCERRPWGYWLVLGEGHGYKIKRLHVDPGARLSYQSHSCRSEHWVVVSGTATCIIDGSVSVARAGVSVDVPLGAKHRLANDGPEELVIVEVQRGSYTGEDDIVRYEDDYGRSAVR